MTDPIKLAREALDAIALRANPFDGVPPPKYFGDIDFELVYWSDHKLEITLGEARAARTALAALDAIPQPAPVPADAELDALDRQADLIRNMLHMGEKIAWGADTGVIDQQRAALSALRTRLAEVEGALAAHT